MSVSGTKNGKSNFRQLELQRTIDQLETRICDMRLAIFAEESLGYLNGNDVVEKKNLLVSLEAQQMEFKRQLRKLQLNQVRQKKYRQRKQRQAHEQSQISSPQPAAQYFSTSTPSSPCSELSSLGRMSSSPQPFPVSFKTYPSTISTPSELEFIEFVQFGLKSLSSEETRMSFLQFVVLSRINFFNEMKFT
jgi:hypothetical protein